MAGYAAYASKASLDWLLGGATPTRPAAWGMGLSGGVPSSTSGSEVGTGSGWSRQTAIFGAAASPAGTASNATAMTFGTGATALSCTGVQLWDTLAATAGNMLMYGTLATARTLGVGDSLVFAVGAVIASLA